MKNHMIRMILLIIRDIKIHWIDHIVHYRKLVPFRYYQRYGYHLVKTNELIDHIVHKNNMI